MVGFVSRQILTASNLNTLSNAISTLQAVAPFQIQQPWDASTGTFPGPAMSGYIYPVSVAGTVGGVMFLAKDQLTAIVNNPSTTVFANNWLKTTGSINRAEIESALGSPLVGSAFSDTTNAANISAGTLPATRLPNPTPSAIGGVKSASAQANQFQTGIDSSGAPTFAQPSAANVSGLALSATTDTTNAANITLGTLPSGRLPSPSPSTLGGVKSASAPSTKYQIGIDTSGNPIFAQPASTDISGLGSLANQSAITLNQVSDLNAPIRTLNQAATIAAFKASLAIASTDISDATVIGKALLTAATKAAVRTYLDLATVANVNDYGADPSYTNDNSAAFAAAIATGLPVYVPSGTYKLSATVALANGQRFYGDGDDKTIIRIPQTFTGNVFSCTGEPGPEVSNLRIQYAANDSSSRAAVATSGNAFLLGNCPRFLIENVAITGFTYGINMVGNSGGAVIRNLKSSCFAYAISIDGSLDTVRIEDLDIYPYDLSPNQQLVMADANTNGVLSGRCDDLQVNGFKAFKCRTAINFSGGSDGSGTFGTGTSFQMDDSCSIVMSTGQFDVVGGYSSSGGDVQ